MYYTYMLRCIDNSIYTGITTDLERRFREHISQKPGKCARYTGSRKAVRIEAAWSAETRETASKLEFRIKKLTKAQKEKLIAEESSFSQFFSEKLQCENYSRVKIG